MLETAPDEGEDRLADGIGMALSRRFFERCVQPILERYDPQLRYSAARIGDGSEVLGFDTTMSADHNYGPALQLLVSEGDFAQAPALMAALEAELPETFEGWAVRYPATGRPAADVDGMLGSTHGVELFTLSAWYRRQLAADIPFPATAADWLAIPEQVLLTVTAGAVFRDDSGELGALRERLNYLPRDVWLAKLAAQWNRIGEEQAFVGRTGDNGDALGSQVLAGRLVRDVMRLGFLIERRYAPYPKWFGAAFARLDCFGRFEPYLSGALAARDWRQREAALAAAYRHAAELQIEHHIPGAIAPVIGPFHERPFTVINADAISAGLVAAIENPELREVPFGAVDQWVDSTAVLSKPNRAMGAQAGVSRRP